MDSYVLPPSSYDKSRGFWLRFGGVPNNYQKREIMASRRSSAISGDWCEVGVGPGGSWKCFQGSLTGVGRGVAAVVLRWVKAVKKGERERGRTREGERAIGEEEGQQNSKGSAPRLF